MTYPMPTGWVPRSVLNGVPTGTNSYSVPGFEDYLSSLREQQTMAGASGVLSEGQMLPEFSGGDPMEYATRAYFSHGSDVALGLADAAGIPRETFLENVSRVNADSQARRGSNIFGEIGDLTRVGRGEVTGAGDFLRDTALLGAIGYGTSFLGGGTGTQTATVSASDTAAGSIAAPGTFGQAAFLPAAGPAAGGPAAAGGGIGSAIMNNLPSILTGAASLIGGRMASNAAEDATNAQIQAGREALDFQRESRDIAIEASRPQLQASNVALARMLSMTGQQIPAALRSALTEAGVEDVGEFDITNDPSYQFRLGESMRALENSAFARGNGMSGGFARSALRYAQDFASTEYANIYARLATIGGYGPAASHATGGAALNYGSNAANIAINTGEARASGYAAQSNAWQNALDQIAQLPWDQWFRRGRTSPTAPARQGSWG